MSGIHHQNLKQLKKLNVKHQKQSGKSIIHHLGYTITQRSKVRKKKNLVRTLVFRNEVRTSNKFIAPENN
jgi:hypothetical protein